MQGHLTAVNEARSKIQSLPLKTFEQCMHSLNVNREHPSLVDLERECIERRKRGEEDAADDEPALKHRLVDALLRGMEVKQQIIMERHRQGDKIQQQIKAAQAKKVAEAKTGRYQHPGKLVTRQADLSGLDSIELRHVESDYRVWDCCGKLPDVCGCTDMGVSD